MDKVKYLIAIIFFFCVNRYEGFAQDNILYTLQAINRISPERFVGDPAFMFGNQDSFSLFSAVYVYFIEMLPIGQASFVFCVLIHALIAFSIAYLVDKWTCLAQTRDIAFPLTLLFISVFSFGEDRTEMLWSMKTIEAFPVARMLSAALGMLGVGLILSKRKWTSFAVLFSGFLIHPLTAGWGIPVWILFYFPKFKLPIVIGSILFPFTILIGKEPFAPFPITWYPVTTVAKYMTQSLIVVLGHLVVMVLFTKQLEKNTALRLFAQYSCVAVSIAAYWFGMSLLTGHILLFQVQTYRVVWLCSIVSFLLQSVFLFNVYCQKIKKQVSLTAYEIICCITIPFLWIDCFFITSLFLIGFLYVLCIKKYETILVKILVILMIVLTVAALVVIRNLPSGLFQSFFSNYSFWSQSLLCASAGVGVMLLILDLKKDFWVLGISLFGIAISLYTKSFFPRDPVAVPYLLMVCFLTLFVPSITKKKLFLQYGLIILMIVFTIFSYDCRTISDFQNEKVMNQFVEQPPFPYIENRGKMLYFVNGYGRDLPRISFLTGAYYDTQYDVGSILVKGQKYEVDRRIQKLYYGVDDSASAYYLNVYPEHGRNAVISKLLDRDSLMSRVKFLCGLNEISHLVIDDGDFPLPKIDSLLLEEKKLKVFLYRCE